MSVVTNERHAFVACVEIQVPVHAIDVPRGFGQTAHNVQCVRALLVKGDCPPLKYQVGKIQIGLMRGVASTDDVTGALLGG